ncbi:hypothetical protein PVL29_002576 [Vitis rotundifolia]|uniref:Uncharacterized protein n=1 Tax=Vitis rotundifolia TaxID=103349 RepID=A0AA39E407_VITRO|nr:hypothetical protein PVL29_002576 [Vitis rotundifolia]
MPIFSYAIHPHYPSNPPSSHFYYFSRAWNPMHTATPITIHARLTYLLMSFIPHPLIFIISTLGCFTLYFIMFLSIASTSKLHKLRELWHSGWWSSKIILWVGLMILPFLVPSAFIKFYEKIARFGVRVFLLIQLISIISFIKWLNDYYRSNKYAYKCHVHVMLLVTIAYVICIMGIILMYICYLMTNVSLHPKIDEGLLTPELMGLELPKDICNQKAESATKANWLTIISFIVVLLAMVIVTFSTDDTQAEDDVPYGYGFFHFVCATWFRGVILDYGVPLMVSAWTSSSFSVPSKGAKVCEIVWEQNEFYTLAWDVLISIS